MRLIGAGFRMVVLASLATLLVAPATRSAQGPSLSTVLSRATHYVDELYERLANVAMEEQYEQRAWRPGPDGLALTRTDAVTLRSDYLLVQPGRDGRHFGFRDVFEANGRAVRDRDERLTELFLDPAASRDRQILDIVADSARYTLVTSSATSTRPPWRYASSDRHTGPGSSSSGRQKPRPDWESTSPTLRPERG